MVPLYIISLVSLLAGRNPNSTDEVHLWVLINPEAVGKLPSWWCHPEWPPERRDPQRHFDLFVLWGGEILNLALNVFQLMLMWTQTTARYCVNEFKDPTRWEAARQVQNHCVSRRGQNIAQHLALKSLVSDLWVDRTWQNVLTWNCSWHHLLITYKYYHPDCRVTSSTVTPKRSYFFPLMCSSGLQILFI